MGHVSLLDLTSYIYRWGPNRDQTIDNIHNTNERHLMAEHMDFCMFFYDLIRNFDAITEN